MEAAEEIVARDRRVVVIGGGDTGSDCVGTALRQGAQSVTQLEILPEPPQKRPADTPWPGWPNILRESHAHKEGGHRRWSVTTKAFEGQGGRVGGLVCADVEWRPQGSAATPVEVTGTDFTLEADLVLLAMGFVGPARNRLVEELGVEQDECGHVRADERNMTNVPGLFVAGDMTQGQSLVVRAIADGRAAAQGILKFFGEKGRRVRARRAGRGQKAEGKRTEY